MTETMSVKISSRYQISVPSAARKELSLEAGDRLLVDIQDGMLILIPEPDSYTERLAGLYSDVWEGLDTIAYLNEERGEWNSSGRD